MIENRKYTLGPDIDLDSEEALEPDGTRLTETRAQELPNRPCTPSGAAHTSPVPVKRSPRVSFRLPADELRAAQELAQREGVPVSELARRAHFWRSRGRVAGGVSVSRSPRLHGVGRVVAVGRRRYLP